MTDIYGFQSKLISGEIFDFSTLKGRSFLVVNTASRCGYTKQYGDLENIYQQAKALGRKLEILAFPCGQFAGQELETSNEIKEFCMTRFAISFLLFEKIDVRGKNADPLFLFLSHALPGVLGSKAIKWNFTKFFVTHEGKPYKRFAPNEEPSLIWNEIQDLCPLSR